MGYGRGGDEMSALWEQFRGSLLGHHCQRKDSLPILRWSVLYNLLQQGTLHARARGMHDLVKSG